MADLILSATLPADEQAPAYDIQRTTFAAEPPADPRAALRADIAAILGAAGHAESVYLPDAAYPARLYTLGYMLDEGSDLGGAAVVTVWYWNDLARAYRRTVPAEERHAACTLALGCYADLLQAAGLGVCWAYWHEDGEPYLRVRRVEGAC